MRITVCLPQQSLELRDDDGAVLARYLVSTSRNGAGEQRGSCRTPRGPHLIRAKIGGGAATNTVFKGRRPSGEVWTPELAARFPDRDWILTRILWLSGMRPGFNRLGEVDTMRRYVYLHGSPDTAPMGLPGSIGCVRMRNADIIDLFDRVPARTRVDIDDFRVRLGGWTDASSEAKAVRETVFVREQNVPADLELDELDASSLHALAFDSAGKVLGTGRLLPDGHIGRMAVLPAARGQGTGRAILDALSEAARERGHEVIRLNAQIQAVSFYQKYGFTSEGEAFLDAGIPHVAMLKRLNPGRVAPRALPA